MMTSRSFFRRLAAHRIARRSFATAFAIMVGVVASNLALSQSLSVYERVRFDIGGLTELGLFPPDYGLAPHGRPVVTCAACGTPADALVGEAVLKAVVAAGRPHRTPGDA